MCLYIRDKEPRVAKRDIVVLKYLTKTNGKFYSPCQMTQVALGKVLTASPSDPDITLVCTDILDRPIYGLSGGAIHAVLHMTILSNYCAKAIIPKGSKYWINLFGDQIAAEKMLITEEVGNNDVLDDSFAREILASAPEVNGIKIGDYQRTDNSFVHPTKRIDKTKVRGIVCGFYENGEPIICALEMFREPWDRQVSSKIGEPAKLRTAMKLFNGKEITRKYIEGYRNGLRFGAFERCINYRKDKGEKWYFGALGEVMTLLDNVIYLNAAHKITGLGFKLKAGTWYWSCSEASLGGSWSYSQSHCLVNFGLDYKRLAYLIIPFYAFK